MKNIIELLLIFAVVSITACANKGYVRPECPDPVRPKLEVTDDKSILEALNQIVNYSLAKDSQTECYKKSLK
jgi:predicted small lipoprotein YifL